MAIFRKKQQFFIPENLGLIPSPPDERDYSLSSVSPTIVRYPETMPCPFDLTVSNQMNVPSCVGHSLSGIKQYLELREKISKEFDGDWLYYEAKKIDGMPNFPGTSFRAGLEVLRKVGAKPKDEQDPSPYKIATYARNDDNTFEGIKKAIFLYGCVLAGFRGSNEGWRGEVIRPPREGEKTWGHAVMLLAYEKDYLIGKNSWGIYAHKNGYFKAPKDYLPFESWVIVLDAPTELKPQPIKTGWVAVNYIQEIGGVWKTTDNLNVREGAGLSYKIIKTLPKGTILNLTNKPRETADGYVWTEIIIS